MKPPSTPGSAPLLDVAGLAKRYGDAPVFSDVSLVMQRGELVALLGESGVGKSTLLNCVAGLDTADAGRIVLAGRDVLGLSEPDAARLRREDLGFVFQFFNLIPTMTAADNVALPLLAEHLRGREVARRVEAALADVGLAGREGRRASELSGGEMQRVSVARALVMDPALVLADEPTGNLDSVTGESILELLCTASRAARRAVLLVTHSYIATAYADRILAMRDGRIVDELPSAERPPAGLHLVGRGPKRH